jgi:hypothetical protein
MRSVDRSPTRRLGTLAALGALSLVVASCDGGNSGVTGPSFQNNPCATGTVDLASGQVTGVDCSNGGTTVTFTGNGASYLVVAQLATEQGSNSLIPYTISTGTPLAASVSSPVVTGPWRAAGIGVGPDRGLMRPGSPGARQAAFEGAVLARGRRLVESGAFTRVRAPAGLARAQAVTPPPAVGSIRGFQVLSSFSTTHPAWKRVGAQLAYAGSSLLLYVDTLAPANGFTTAQLQTFGQYFDQTLVPIDTGAFGGPSDVDGNGRVIMLMSPVVNADSPASECSTLGYVSGFFDPQDFDGPQDSVSNQGEIFYSIVPDSTGTVSCAHSASDVEFTVPATFLHELQHLIDFSQHVILGGGNLGASWMDEGLSIVAEELGSVYYERKCPPPACRTDPAQLFPDSSQPFVQTFLYDSYQYGLLPDSASVTLHSDEENGFAWRGGDWLLMRWLGDQYGDGVFKLLERGASGGVADIENATGQSFPALFTHFGLALYVDSLPGLPRNTAPESDRFVSRNLRRLWARLYGTTGGQVASIPRPMPIVLRTITADTTQATIDPGTMAFFRLDTPANTATVTVRFARLGGAPFAASLGPQLAVFRMPAGQ